MTLFIENFQKRQICRDRKQFYSWDWKSGWELIANEHKETSDDGDILKLDFGHDYTTV